MALVSKSIPNLINGVSQQPPALRLPTQGEAQENGLSDVVDGLKKRPPTKYLNKLVKKSTAQDTAILSSANTTPLNLTNCYITTYKRSQTEQYTVVIETDNTTPVIYVYDINGNLNYQSKQSSWDWTSGSCVHVATNNDSTEYLKGITKEEMTSTSVADATFIVNKSKVVAKKDDIDPPEQPESALVYLKSVNYGRQYKVNVTNNAGLTLSGSIDIPSQIQTPSTGTNNTSVLRTSSVISDIYQDLRTAALSSGSNNDSVYSIEYSSLGRYPSHPTLITNANDTYAATPPNSVRTINIGTIIPAATMNQVSDPNGGVYEAQDFPRANVGTAGTAADAGVTIMWGSRTIPYAGHGNSSPTDNEWVWLDSNGNIDANGTTRYSILLPPNYVLRWRVGEQSSYYPFYWATFPPFEIINVPPSSAKITLSPTEGFGDKPYFVITAPPEGSFGDGMTVEARDDDGGQNLRVFKDTAKSFTDLPNQCVNNFQLQVAGDNNKKEDNFYVKFSSTGNEGVWKETVASGVKNKFDTSTMPHTLKQKVDSNNKLFFEFTEGTDNEDNAWRDRKAGDDSTNPFPSFVGNTINDIFFHRSRLGIISGENVIFSETNNYFNFFRTTVRALLDSDPIDVAVSQNEVSELKAALPIQDSLLLFSELNQFTLSASQLLTPAEVTIDQSTKFECDLRTPPVGAGNSVFFNTVGGNYSGVREYYTDGDTEIKDATLITSHVPAYLSGNVRKMAASTNEDMLICLTSAVKSEAYIYKWYNSNNERLQSSWSKWTFDKNVADLTFNNSDLYITFEDGSFEKVDLTSEAPQISFVITNNIKADLTSTAAINTTSTLNGFTYIIKGFMSQEGGVFYTGFSPDISSGFGSIDNASITELFLYKETDTSVTPNTSVYKLHGTIDRRKLNILKLEDYPTSITLEGITVTLDNSYSQGQLDSLQGNQLLAVAATITETQFNALFNNSSTPTEITLNRVSHTFTKKDYPVHLDHQVKLQASTSAASSFTTADLNTAYTATSVTQFVDHKGDVIATGNSDAAKAKVVAVIHNKEHTENGSTVGSYVYAGEPYTFKYQLSEQVFTPERGDTTDLARFQLRNISFKYNDTGTFNVTTGSTGRTPKVSKFTGRIVGQANNLLGYAAVVDNGSYKVGVQSQAKETDITITNDSHLPSTFQSAEYEAWVTLRNQRL